MKDNFSKACKELYICLNNIDSALLENIPVKFLRVIIENMDNDYCFCYDYNKKIYEQNLLEETRNLIGYMYYKFWTDESEKENFKNIVISNYVNTEKGFNINWDGTNI